MSESFNLPLLRIWCRKKDAWLSFRTRNGDRYFVNPYGYFVELPDARLAPVTPRVAFPLINCYPSVLLSDLDVQAGFGSAAYFVYALRRNDVIGQPQPIKLNELRYELDQVLSGANRLSPPEKYVAIRVIESGLLTEEKLYNILENRDSGKTLGQEIIQGELCRWEILLATCLDTRSPGSFDPPGEKRRTFMREWELAGEILIAMGKITRSKLEYALQIKREGQKTLGEILTALGACTEEDIQKCLLVQDTARGARGSEVSLIGELLVQRGIITRDMLNDALQRQRISGQPLGTVLLSLRYCRLEDIDQYKRENGWHQFQGDIDDGSLANWLLMRGKIDQQRLQHAVTIQGRGRQILGQILTAMGVCTNQDIEEALRMQKQSRTRELSNELSSEQLGNLLTNSGKVSNQHIEAALSLQKRGRRALGEILMSVGGCSEAAVRLAIEIQTLWRRQVEGKEDRLGEVLQQRGFLSKESLQQVIQLQHQSGKPMGQVIVEHGICTPEEIIATLLMRDYKRQCDLHVFIKRQMVAVPEQEATTERLLATWLQNHPKG